MKDFMGLAANIIDLNFEKQTLLLDCFHKAYIRGLFTSEFKCPISLEEIEFYLQILLPAFQFNLIMQKTRSTIADVLPTLVIMISK